MEIKVNLKNVKNFRMVIEPDGSIRVSAPYRSTKKEIDDFIKKCEPWIKKHYEKAVDETITYKLIEGERVFILGREYSVRIISDSRDFVDLSGSFLNIHVKEVEMKRIERTFSKYLKALTISTYNEIMEKYLLITGEHIESLEIKKLRRAYGKCYYRERRIILSSLMIHKTYEFIESVVLHEIAHLKFHDHQKGFYEYILDIMPDYKERQKKFKY